MWYSPLSVYWISAAATRKAEEGMLPIFKVVGMMDGAAGAHCPLRQIAMSSTSSTAATCGIERPLVSSLRPHAETPAGPASETSGASRFSF
jgi:hypothetical protein